jgi:Tfp pilus assembly PilM family ATPase
MSVRKVASALIPPDVDADSPSALGEFIRRVLDLQKLRVKNAIVDVPRHWVVLDVMRLPPSADDELPAMVQFQIARDLPFPAEEAIVDFAVSRRVEAEETPDEPERTAGGEDWGPAGGVEVLVAAVRRDVLEHIRAVCEHAGLQPIRVGLRPYANMVAASHVLGAESDGNTLFVDVGPEMTEIDIIADGRLAFARSAQVSTPFWKSHGPGGSDTAEAQTAIDELIAEIRRSIQSYMMAESENTAPVSQIIVAGGTGIEEMFVERVGTELNAPAQLFRPPPEIGGAGDLHRETRAFAAAFGLALGHSRPGSLHFDFANPKRPIDREARRKRKKMISAAAAIVLAIGGFAAGKQAVAAREARLETLTAERKKADKAAKKLGKFEAEIKQIKEWRDDSIVWLDVLKEINDRIPDTDDVFLTSFRATRGKTAVVTLMGNAEREEHAKALWSRLDDHPAFNLPAVPFNPKENRKFPHYRFPFKFEVEIDPQELPKPTPAPDPSPSPDVDEAGVRPESRPAEPEDER